MSNVEIKSFDEQKPIARLRYLLIEEIARLNSLRLGKILTVLDASIADAEQRKAIKDLIKQYSDIKTWYLDIDRMLFEFDYEFVKDKMTEEEAKDFFEPDLSTRLTTSSDYRSYFKKSK